MRRCIWLIVAVLMLLCMITWTSPIHASARGLTTGRATRAAAMSPDRYGFTWWTWLMITGRWCGIPLWIPYCCPYWTEP